MLPINRIGLYRLKSEFDRCWPWLWQSVLYNAYVKDGKPLPTHRKEHVWPRITSGKNLLWAGRECAILTEIVTYPTGLKIQHTWLAGGNKDEIKQMMVGIEEYGRALGCHQQRGSGRLGWLRVFSGYRIIGYRKAKDLR